MSESTGSTEVVLYRSTIQHLAPDTRLCSQEEDVLTSIFLLPCGCLKPQVTGSACQMQYRLYDHKDQPHEY